MVADHLGEGRPHRVTGVERGERVLEDHLHDPPLCARAFLCELPTVDAHLSVVLALESADDS